jgi:hypothetical protein
MLVDKLEADETLYLSTYCRAELAGLRLRTIPDQKFGYKKRVSYFYRTAQPNTLALFPTWGSQWELVVEDLPATKVEKKIVLGKKKCLFILGC